MSATILTACVLILPILLFAIAEFFDDRVATKKKMDKMHIEATKTLLQNTATYVRQTFIDRCIEEGTYDSEAQAQSLNMVKNMFLATLGDDTKRVIRSSYGDLETWVNNNVEIITAYDAFGRAVAEFKSPEQPKKQSVARCPYCGCKVDASDLHCKSCGAPL